MTNQTVRLFVGDTITEPSEREFVSRLRVNLERLGMRATLYANFFPRRRRPPQVDVLVRTDRRTMYVEVKSMQPDRPVSAHSNGPWVQLQVDGSELPLGSNAGRQALKGTYAISDAMRELARNGHVSAPEGEFYLGIDTVVGMWKDIPDDSDIEPPPHVTVLGYGDLLQRLCTAGPRVPWNDAEWDSFARSLNLYQPDAESDAERHRRSQLDDWFQGLGGPPLVG